MEQTQSSDAMPLPSKDFLAREKRFTDAISLKTPDRVPVANMAITFMTRYAGLSDAQAFYQYDKMADAWIYSAKALNADIYNSPMILTPGPVLDLLGSNTFKWPKMGENENVPFQFVEDEFLKSEEYDAFIRDPSDVTIRTLMPRMAKVFEPLAMLPPLCSFSSPYMHFGPLAFLAELPPGTIAAHFDRVDKKKFQTILGNTMCFWGDVPAGLLVAGEKQEVIDYVKGLLDMFDGQGLIVDGSVESYPPESKVENVEALIQTVFEYGKN